MHSVDIKNGKSGVKMDFYCSNTYYTFYYSKLTNEITIFCSSIYLGRESKERISDMSEEELFQQSLIHEWLEPLYIFVDCLDNGFDYTKLGIE